MRKTNANAACHFVTPAPLFFILFALVRHLRLPTRWPLTHGEYVLLERLVLERHAMRICRFASVFPFAVNEAPATGSDVIVHWQVAPAIEALSSNIFTLFDFTFCRHVAPRMMLGEIDEVLAVTGRHIGAMQGESWAQALLRFQSGVVASFHALLHRAPVGPTEDFRVTGVAGEVVIEHGPEGRLMLFNAEHPQGLEVMRAFPGKVDSYGAELRDFSLAVLEGKPLDAAPEYSLGELRTALAMYRSAESRRWEKVWR